MGSLGYKQLDWLHFKQVPYLRIDLPPSLSQSPFHSYLCLIRGSTGSMGNQQHIHHAGWVLVHTPNQFIFFLHHTDTTDLRAKPSNEPQS